MRAFGQPIGACCPAVTATSRVLMRTEITPLQDRRKPVPGDQSVAAVRPSAVPDPLSSRGLWNARVVGGLKRADIICFAG